MCPTDRTRARPRQSRKGGGAWSTTQQGAVASVRTRIPVSDVVTDDHPVDGCMWSGSSSSLVSMRREKAGRKAVVRRKLRSCQVRSGSGDAVEAHAAHPHAPHMLPLKKKPARESTASFKVNSLAGSGNWRIS